MRAKILYEELKRLVDATKEFTARHTPNCIQSYIRMEFYTNDDTVRACACDGYKLSLEWGECDYVDEDFTAYIKPNAAEILGAYAWSWDEIELGVAGNVTEVKAKNASLTYKTEGMEPFIDADKYIPADGLKFRIGFNPKYMMSVLNAELENNPVKMELYYDVSPIFFRSETNGHENIRLLMPMDLHDKPAKPTQLERAAKLARELIDLCSDSDILGLNFENGLHITDELFSACIPSNGVTTTKREGGVYPYLHEAIWHDCPVQCVSYKENLYE